MLFINLVDIYCAEPSQRTYLFTELSRRKISLCIIFHPTKLGFLFNLSPHIIQQKRWIAINATPPLSSIHCHNHLIHLSHYAGTIRVRHIISIIRFTAVHIIPIQKMPSLIPLILKNLSYASCMFQWLSFVSLTAFLVDSTISSTL